MEVFPALALASYSQAFFGYRKGPRYHPDRNTFRIEDWIATIDAAIQKQQDFVLAACRLAQRVTDELAPEKSRPGSPIIPRCASSSQCDGGSLRGKCLSSSET